MSYATWVLLPLGRLDEAFSEYKRAAALDPVTPLLSVAPSMALFHQQEYDRVIEELQKTLELDPNIFWAHFLLGEAYLHKGEYGNASDLPPGYGPVGMRGIRVGGPRSRAVLRGASPS